MKSKFPVILIIEAIWETFCFISMIHHFNQRGNTRPPLWFWRDDSKREIDFIIEENNTVTLIESKFRERVTQNDSQIMRYWKEKSTMKHDIKMQIMAPVKEAYPVLPNVWVDWKPRVE